MPMQQASQRYPRASPAADAVPTQSLSMPTSQAIPRQHHDTALIRPHACWACPWQRPTACDCPAERSSRTWCHCPWQAVLPKACTRQDLKASLACSIASALIISVACGQSCREHIATQGQAGSGEGVSSRTVGTLCLNQVTPFRCAAGLKTVVQLCCRGCSTDAAR